MSDANDEKQKQREDILLKLITLLEDNKRLKEELGKPVPRKKRTPRKKDDPAEADVDDPHSVVRAKVEAKLKFLDPPAKKRVKDRVAEKFDPLPEMLQEEESVAEPSTVESEIKIEIREKIEESTMTPKQIVEKQEAKIEQSIQQVAQEVAMSFKPDIEKAKISGIKQFLGTYRNKYL
jgi:hypothetical protein